MGLPDLNWDLLMTWECDAVLVENCVTFFKVKEPWGELSNMSNDFPLRIGTVAVGSSEALYQAMRYPHRPDWQREILDAPHAMQAKMKSKKEGRRKTSSRPDWEAVQIEAMRWVLMVKLAQHPRTFGRVLRTSGTRAIVERSRKDRYWGAVADKDGVLRGKNWLGRLLMELRDGMVSQGDAAVLRVEQPLIDNCLLLGQPIPPSVNTGVIK